MFVSRSLAVRYAVALCLFGSAFPGLVGSQVLYDGSAATPPSSQGWLYLTSPFFGASAVRSLTEEAVILDTMAALGDNAGWFSTLHPEVPVLDRSAGYSLRFDLQVLAEEHVTDSRAGLSVIALADDARGVEIGFWQDKIWVQGDDPLFKRAETVSVNTSSALDAYHLNVMQDGYSLVANAQVLLHGNVRDYSSFGAPYESPNFIFVGDNSSWSRARFALGRIEARSLFQITSIALPDARVDQSYSHYLTVAADTGSLQWSIDEGQLPAGLELDAATGELFGLPSLSGAYRFVVMVVNEAGNLALAELNLQVNKAAARFIHRPYVQRPKAGGMTLVWWSDSATPVGLRFGTDALDQFLVSTPEAINLTDPEHNGEVQRWRHLVALEGLQPDTRYRYRVDQGGEVFEAAFHTAPAQTLAPIRFLVWADTETEPASVGRLGSGAPADYPMDQDQGIRAGVRASLALQPDFILLAGDLVQEGGRLSDWDELFARINDPVDGWLAASVPMIAVPGNHDYWGGSFDQPGSEVHALQKFLSHLINPSNIAATRRVNPNWPSERNSALRAAQDGRYFRFRYGPATFIGLDVNNQGLNRGVSDTNWHLLGEGDAGGGAAPDWMPGSRQYQWLEETLQSAQRQTPFIFVFWHHAPWSQGPHNRQPEQDKQVGTPTRALDALLHRYGVTAVFNGHEEMMEHSETVGNPKLGGNPAHRIRYFIPGTVGDGLRAPVPGVENPQQVFHYAHSSIGRHYGFLVVDIAPGDAGSWNASFRQAWIDPAAAHDPAVDPLGGYYDQIDAAAYFEATVDAPDADNDGEPDRLTVHQPLMAGLNLISLTALIPGSRMTCGGLIAELEQTTPVRSIQHLDASGRLESCSDAPGSEFSLVPGMGLLVDLAIGTGIDQSWQRVCPSVPLYPGGNLIGHPAAPLGLTCHGWLSAQLNHIDNTVTSIAGFDAETGHWKTCALRHQGSAPATLQGADFAILPGHGYRVYSSQSGTMLLPGCD